MKKDNLPGESGVPKVEAPKRKGMTLDEIRYRRAVLALKKDFCKEKVLLGREKLMKQGPFAPKTQSSGSRLFDTVATIAGRFSGKMKVLDYVMVGVSAYSAGKRVLGMFRKKKKS